MSQSDSLERFFAAAHASPTLRACFGGDAFSFVTSSELDRIASSLNVKAGDVVLDIGCGTGGPALAIAHRTGATILGIDRSRAAIDVARARGLSIKDARFVVGDWEGEWHSLPVNGSHDAIVSFDALQLMDARHALENASHYVKMGGRIAFTTWEIAKHVQVPAHVEKRVVRDWHALVGACSFENVVVEEPEGWREHQLGVYERMRAAESALRKELGDVVAEMILDEANSEPVRIANGEMRRVLVMATRDQQKFSHLFA